MLKIIYIQERRTIKTCQILQTIICDIAANLRFAGLFRAFKKAAKLFIS